MRIVRFAYWYTGFLWQVMRGKRRTHAPITPHVRWRQWNIKDRERRGWD